MKKIIFNKAFLLGWIVAVLSFVFINLMTLTVDRETRLYHKMNGIGFPFAFYEWGGNPYVERFSQFGIVADVLILLVYSCAVAVLFSFLWRVQVKHNARQ